MDTTGSPYVIDWAGAAARLATAAGLDASWYAAVAARLVEQRNRRFPGGHSADWHPPASWHVDALRAAGFAEAGVVWRG
ncbi:MAG TPA: hypothetical protein VFT95_00720, partial [Micromonosporaceae bacterium]|nr:hypothetical protein [Micromonosporaceae bacterium]